MPTREEVQARLDKILQKKADTLKTVSAKAAKLKAQLASFDRPTKTQRRLETRCKILLGAFVLETLQNDGDSLQSFVFRDRKFADWLVRPTDKAALESFAAWASSSPSSGPSSQAKTDTP